MGTQNSPYESAVMEADSFIYDRIDLDNTRLLFGEISVLRHKPPGNEVDFAIARKFEAAAGGLRSSGGVR
jgi:hypothetical protein